MTTPYVGEIRMFAGNFAPRGWALCDGQLLAVSQNDALFSLLGTTYGGDGRTTFGLPDLRGRLPIHAGNGPGLTPRSWGARGGVEEVTLTVNQLPSHGHAPVAQRGAGDRSAPTNALWANSSSPTYTTNQNTSGTMNVAALSPSGGGQAHTNEMPFLCVNFIIALSGIYPSAS